MNHVAHIINCFQSYGLGDPKLLVLRAHYIRNQILIFTAQQNLEIPHQLTNFLTIIYAYRSIQRQIYSHKAFCAFINSYEVDFPENEIMAHATECGYFSTSSFSQSARFCQSSYDFDAILSSFFKGKFGFDISLDFAAEIARKISPETAGKVVLDDFEKVVCESQIVNKYGVEIVVLILLYFRNQKIGDVIQETRLGYSDIKEMTKRLNLCLKEVSEFFKQE
ncbi:hypothetical protein SS50377_21988 [Spironucleus salmonicida]|uniref:Uncharacterized protein n=1 Tax=Spironucleus salmonicida TaxID=348837 RepID=V6LQS4_9EUKA|nr:hypothetical protein SS50377_21988 [Spironucleus salmonicida]|eukprot:EST47027.1 Hypothetical protein SS50377_12983 [Spironucleus salmonicida]